MTAHLRLYRFRSHKTFRERNLHDDFQYKEQTIIKLGKNSTIKYRFTLTFMCKKHNEYCRKQEKKIHLGSVQVSKRLIKR